MERILPGHSYTLMMRFHILALFVVSTAIAQHETLAPHSPEIGVCQSHLRSLAMEAYEGAVATATSIQPQTRLQEVFNETGYRFRRSMIQWVSDWSSPNPGGPAERLTAVEPWYQHYRHLRDLIALRATADVDTSLIDRRAAEFSLTTTDNIGGALDRVKGSLWEDIFSPFAQNPGTITPSDADLFRAIANSWIVSHAYIDHLLTRGSQMFSVQGMDGQLKEFTPEIGWRALPSGKVNYPPTVERPFAPFPGSDAEFLDLAASMTHDLELPMLHRRNLALIVLVHENMGTLSNVEAEYIGATAEWLRRFSHKKHDHSAFQRW